MNKRHLKREQQISQSIDEFLSVKRHVVNDKSLFERTFETYKTTVGKESNSYILDMLTQEQRDRFKELYLGHCCGGGTFPFQDNVYRIHYRIFAASIFINHKSN